MVFNFVLAHCLAHRCHLNDFFVVTQTGQKRTNVKIPLFIFKDQISRLGKCCLPNVVDGDASPIDNVAW